MLNYFIFCMGVRKNQKQSLKRRELPGRNESMAFREMGQRAGRYFNCGKK
jgi:hypothetical protein